MLSWLGIALLGVAAVSSFTVHQHSDNSECINLQCPETAFDYGVKILVNDDTMHSDQCTSCSQCTENGYSICLRQKDSRAHRTATETTGFCSCTHSVPANCHNQLHISTHPANITMKLYNICYQSAIQAPPRPLAVHEKDSVIMTIESFWHEPYWRDMTMENLTLHYEFVVKTPEVCEGELITLESDHLEHLCKSFVKMNMTSITDGTVKDDDYEHSDNYDQYDDELPPEVQFERDVFDGAKLLKAYYTVEVRRPRQLDTKNSDPFRDVTTTLESEHLKFDLKPEEYGVGTPELPESKKETESATEDDDEDISSEHPVVGTDFFDDGKKVKDTKSEEDLEKEEEKLEKAIAETDKTTDEDDDEVTTVVAEKDDEEEKKESEEKEGDDEEKTDKTDDEEEEKNNSEEKNEDEEKEEGGDNEDEEKKDDDDEEKTEDGEANGDEKADEEEGEKNASEEQNNEDEKDEETDENTEKTADEDEEAKDEDASAEDEEEDSEEGEKGFFGSLLRDQYHLARWVFGVTIASCILLIVCTCCYRRGFCCCKPSDTKTTSNGNRYTNANRPELTPLTSVGAEIIPVSESEQRMFKDILIRAEALNPTKLEMGSTIGSGRFGSWNRALFNSFNGSVLDVAVYSIKSPIDQSPTEFRALASLLKETVAVGMHPNVLSLKAAHLDKNALVLLWEPISHPTLQGVLRESRCSRFGSSPYKTASFLSPERLLSIMIGCTTGVDHLLKRNIFHSHLAAANVLVAERGQVKISGFGLAETSVLCREHEARPSPLRWMSPEHFRSDRRPAKESQIWSLGVLLWEVISLGGTPYSNVRTSREVIDSLRDSTAKLQEVSYCGTALMDLIHFCTSHEPSARPDPDTILRRLECIAADAQHHIDLRMKENFPYLPVCTQIEQQKLI